MAKIQFGPVASDIRGSTGGTVFSRNKGGAYLRARVVGINPNTPKQSLVRSNFGVSSKDWSAVLSSGQRAAWTFFAQANPVINNMGASIQLSGLSMFNRLNQILKQAGLPTITDPPVNLDVPAIPVATAFAVDSAGGTIRFTTLAQAAPADTSYYIRATGPLAPGRIPQQNQYRYMDTVPPQAAGTTVDFAGAWVATFGGFIAGTVVGGQIAQLNINSGALTPFLTFYADTV